MPNFTQNEIDNTEGESKTTTSLPKHKEFEKTNIRYKTLHVREFEQHTPLQIPGAPKEKMVSA